MSTAKKAIKAAVFVAFHSYSSIFVAFVTGIVLARLLDPADFGLYSLSIFFWELLGRFKEFGLDKALIHKQENLEKSFRTHFTLQVIFYLMGLLLAIIFYPILARAYSQKVATFVVILGVFVLFQGLSSTQKVFLEKSLKFKWTVVFDLISLMFSSLVTIFLAFRGFGALSLVFGYGLNFFFNFIFLWWWRPWRVSWRDLILFDRAEIKFFLKFGLFLFLGGLTTFILFRYNVFILGTFLSLAALGYYSRAFNYAQIPTSIITGVVSRVALPTYAALQNEPVKLAQTFNIVLKSIVRVSFPLSLILYMTADDFTVFVLGPKWIPMIPIFRILLIYGVLRSIFDDLGELFTAVGQPKIVSFYLFFQALLTLVLAPFLVFRFQAEGAAFSLVIVLAVGVFLGYFLARRVVKIDWLSVFGPTSLVCLLTFLGFKLAVSAFGLNLADPLASLLTKAGVFAFFYLIFVIIFDGRAVYNDWRHLILGHLQLKDVPEEKADDL